MAFDRPQRATGHQSDCSSFAELASFLKRAPTSKLQPGARICIVTNELVAFHKNGGIGTANSGLVDALLKAGFKVSIIYTALLDLQSDDVLEAISGFRIRGVDFCSLQESVPLQWMHSPRRISYACYWLLRRQNPEIAHFNDFGGNGFYAAQARLTGTALRDTMVVVTVHGTSRWAARINEKPMSTSHEQELCFLEERTIEFADVVLGVSRHLLNWLRDEGVALPKHSYIHKNIMPAAGNLRSSGELLPGQLSEVVFFARHEIRKGFLIMLQAIGELSATMPQLKFTFLGKFSHIYGEHSGAVALDQLHQIPNQIDFRHNLDRDDGLRYLRRPGVLAVMPSLDENSPCTVVECIVEGIPFVASAVGGVPELVAQESHATVLFEPTAAALAARIREIAVHGLNRAVLAFDPDLVAGQMIDGFATLYSEIQRHRLDSFSIAERARPLVSVVVAHFNRHTFLKQLLSTLENSTYTNFEVVLVDDGSTNADTVAYLDELSAITFSYKLTLVRTGNRYLGAARNTGVRLAQGEFVKFQDDDNVPLPHEIEYLVQAAICSNADIVTCFQRIVSEETQIDSEIELSDLEYFPLGASLPLSLARNEYGDANALVRRDSFLEDGGFTELFGVGFEDYEFFMKSECLGRRIVVVPEPLFNYRAAGSRMSLNGSLYRDARRARAGLRHTNERWLRQQLDSVHEAALALKIRSHCLWNAGNREFGDVHRRMIEGSPHSPENILHLRDLASRYGRPEHCIPAVTDDDAFLNSRRRRILQLSDFADLQLTSPTEDLPADLTLMKMTGAGLLLHALPGRVTEVLVPQAVAENAQTLAVRFSHRNARGGTARMGFGVRSNGMIVAETGWVDIIPGSATYAAVVIEPGPIVKDLLLRSTVDGNPDCAWAFADHLIVEF